MKLQDYIKYLICILLVNFGNIDCNGRVIDVTVDDQIKIRHERGVLDLLLGRFRTCGACLCGRPNRKAARLLGGEYTESHEFPWLANIHIKSKLLVSGVLINDRYVLTAASQLIGTTAHEIKASLGEYDRCNLDISSVNISVESITLHPEFNPESSTHDLALIRLSRPTKIEKRISPICLPNPGSTYLGQVGTLVGWTKHKDQADNAACRPRKLGLPILGQKECIKSGINAMNLHDDYGCIGIVGTNSLVCENDVGSSVQYRSYSGIYDLIGIIPSVNKCDDSPKPTVFTRVGSSLDWILQHTKDACYCTNKDDLKVSVGAHNSCKWDAKSIIFSVKNILPHPDYNRNTNFADIMLVKLIMRITFNKLVRPICLPKLELDAASQYEGQSVSALGWGFSENEFLFNTDCSLRVVDLTLFKRSECPTNVSTLLCAGYKEAPRGTCGGDSGGPLQILDENYKYILIGITSSGLLCADVDYPDFYTDVTQMMSWILQESRIMKPHLILMTVIGILLILDAAHAQKHRLRINRDCECGLTGGISNRIVGGKITIPHIFPWVVAILNKDSLHCGGTLINNQYVLTAGHCVQWTNQADLSVGVGMHDIEDPSDGYIAAIDEIILHEDFESDYLHDTNDIALIRLQHPVKIDENVRPACLPHKGSDYTEQYVKVTGWGRVQVKGPPSQFLRQATLKVMSFAACKNTSFGDHITESMMCAYNDNTDACQGDSGGPLLYQRIDGKYEVVGIVSWGIGCADPGIPGVYVKNSDYLNWIKYHSRDGIFCVDR
ncbi:ovochymase-2 [Mycetomoellerius zeteki]|uniref:ovochymase-2 n=1 Tax=Mycetomoellerius zeteki TaxID=64791 RepID=UPI00084E91DA|nr:PREDICTED: ovochymase-2-like [Trachymyrmex zeteki]